MGHRWRIITLEAGSLKIMSRIKHKQKKINNTENNTEKLGNIE